MRLGKIASLIAGMLWMIGATSWGQAAKAKAPQLSAGARQQLRELLLAKQNRTFVERKIGSDLGMALKAAHGQRLTPSLDKLDRPIARVGTNRLNGMVTVSIRGVVSPDLLSAVRASGGTVQYSSALRRTVRARVPLGAVERLAARTDVARIHLPPAPHHNGIRMPAQLSQLPALGLIRPGVSLAFPVPQTGLLATQGVISHQARNVHTQLGILGAGVKVGVLSDSVDFLDALIDTGDIGADAVVLPGQSGNGEPGTASEGTAMMEIVHDMAPGAQTYFATAWLGIESFADNIKALRDAGCQVIVDDVVYFPQTPFQDGIVGKAVNDVASTGSLYFSAAGNLGNLTWGTSGTWEGDPEDLGTLDPWIIVHANVLVAQGSMVTLAWADPLGGSANDYDLAIFDPTGTFLVDGSFDVQDGTQDPLEAAGYTVALDPGSIILALKYAGADRAMNLNTIGGSLLLNTSGAIFGQAASENAMAAAAVNWNSARRGTRPFTGGAPNPTEVFSSDGFRRVFYQPNGTPITPGNFLFATGGGRTLVKPDIAAADGAVSVTPGFSPFFGTSAAAPHAAAIAALVKSAKPSLTRAQIRQIMLDTALNNMAPGVDRDSGKGIVMALPAVQKALQ